MARTLQTIYNSIITEKETFSSLDSLVPNPDTAQTFLSDLTTTSKVAIWRLTFWVVAFAIWTHEKLFDIHAAEINARALEVVPGTLRWYVNNAKAFQNGYSLTYNETTQKFEYSDTTSVAAVASKIVTQASAIEGTNDLIIKVAQGVAGSLTVLSASELVSFTDYIDQTKFAGTAITIINESADDIKMALTIYYDPLVIEIESGSPDRGRSIADNTIYPVETAVTNYIQGIPFDAKFRLLDLVDAIQAASGVLNVVVNNCDARYGVIAYTDITAETDQSYVTRAGYLDFPAGFEVNAYYNSPTNTIATLTYIAG